MAWPPLTSPGDRPLVGVPSSLARFGLVFLAVVAGGGEKSCRLPPEECGECLAPLCPLLPSQGPVNK